MACREPSRVKLTGVPTYERNIRYGEEALLCNSAHLKETFYLFKNFICFLGLKSLYFQFY